MIHILTSVEDKLTDIAAEEIESKWQDIKTAVPVIWDAIVKLTNKITSEPKIWIPTVLIFAFACTHFLKRK